MAETTLNNNQVSNILTIDDIRTIVYDFSSSSYLRATDLFYFESGTSYDFMFHFITGSSTGVPIFTSIDVEGTGGGFDLSFDGGNGGRLFISQSGTSLDSGWSIDTSLGNMSKNTEYWLHMTWNGTVYSYVLATDKTFSNIVQTTTENYSYPIRNSTNENAKFGSSIRFSNGFTGGRIYISDCYLKINGAYAFDGRHSSNYNIVGTPSIKTAVY